MTAPVVRTNFATHNPGSNETTLNFGAEPAGWAQDDILIAIIGTQTAAPTITPPVDITWTSIDSQSSSGVFIQAFWARRGASAPSYSFGISTSKPAAILFAVSGCISTGSPIDAGGVGKQSPTGNGTAFTIAGITTVVADCLLVGCAAVGNNSTFSGWTLTSPASITELADLVGSANNSAAFAAGARSGAGATGNLSVTATGSGSRIGMLFALKPGNAVTIAVTATGTASLAKVSTFLKAISVTATGTVSRVNRVGKNIAVTATGTVSRVNQVRKNITVTATGTISIVKKVLKNISVTGTGTVVLTKTKTFAQAISVVATGTASISKRVSKNISVTSTATVSAIKSISKNISVTATGTALLGKTQDFAMSVIAHGVASITMRIGRSRPSSLQHEYNQSVVRRTVEYGQRVYRKLREYGQKVSRDGN